MVMATAAERERRQCLPREPHGAHAGLPPIERSTSLPISPTMVTSSPATIEPATSAAHMSMVWL